MPETIEYRSLPQYDGYRFGSDGSFWSQHRPFGQERGEWRQLKGSLGPEGYIIVRLKRASGRKCDYRPLHQLILEAFVGPRPCGYEACHNDGNKTNNAALNLRWDTRSENMLDRGRHGYEPRKTSAATRNEIRRRYGDGEPIEKLQQRFGLSLRRIQAIGRGEVSRREVSRVATRPRGFTTEFGRRLDGILKTRRVGRSELARTAGVGRNTIDEWIHAGAMPNSKALMAIAVHLGISVDYLLGLADGPTAVVPFDAMPAPAGRAVLKEIDAVIEAIGPAEALRRLALNSPRRRPQPSGA